MQIAHSTALLWRLLSLNKGLRHAPTQYSKFTLAVCLSVSESTDMPKTHLLLHSLYNMLKKKSLKGQLLCNVLCDITKVTQQSLLWQVFVLDLLIFFFFFLEIFEKETMCLSEGLLCQTAQLEPSINKINENETICGCFTLERLSLDHDICIVTCSNPSSYPPSFPYHRLSEFKYWPQKTSDFFFLFCADCILTDGIILLMI